MVLSLACKEECVVYKVHLMQNIYKKVKHDMLATKDMECICRSV